ncbi:hypothetical protein ACEF06_12350 [Brevibacillus agri]|nr:hypothetical protein [Brevibacillus sp. NSP2.1]QHZ57347.1 hypothetical protein M655_017715 [Brevibacillus sp. NSP2.1]
MMIWRRLAGGGGKRLAHQANKNGCARDRSMQLVRHNHLTQANTPPLSR